MSFNARVVVNFKIKIYPSSSINALDVICNPKEKRINNQPSLTWTNHLFFLFLLLIVNVD